MRWEVRDDEVWLIVEDDEDVQVEHVVRECDAAGYCALDVLAVQEVLDTLDPKMVARLDERRHAGLLDVHVDHEGRTATLTITPPGDMAEPLTLEDVEAALALAEVRLGIDHMLVNSLALDVAGEYLVATGWDPSSGHDGQVQYVVEPTHEFRPKTRDDGGVDFHAVATIPDVQTGQLLAAVTEPGPGTPGRTVRGDPVPPEPGTAAELPTGDNVTASDDGRRLYAAVDGLLEITAGRVSVRPEYVIDGDVDLETGSVSFSGNIIVRGSVRPGFRVIAGGQVVVMGDVEDAEVRGENLVWVSGAVVGDRSVVQSDGDVKVRTVQHGRVEARRNVFIEREAYDATILAGSNLVLEQPRNRISGGSAWVGQEVLAGEIGTVGGAATRINVGVDPFAAELAETLTAVRAERRGHLDRIETTIAPFVAKPGALAALPDNRRRAVKKLIAIAASLRAQIADLEHRMEDLRPEMDDSRPRVVARLALRPGVVIAARGSTYAVQRTQHRVAATAIDGQVTLVPLGSERMPVGPSRPT